MKSVIVALLLVASVTAITVTEMQVMLGLVYMLPVNNNLFQQPLEAGSSVALKVLDENQNLVHYFCFPPSGYFSIVADRYDGNQDTTEEETIALLSLSPAAEGGEGGLAAQAASAPQQVLNLFGRASAVEYRAVTCQQAFTPATLSINTIYQARLNNRDFISFAPGATARLVGSFEGVNVNVALPPKGSVLAEVISSVKDVLPLWEYNLMDGPEGTNLTGSASDNPVLSYTPVKCATNVANWNNMITKWWVERIGTTLTVKSQAMPGSAGCVLDGPLTAVPATTIVGNTGTSCGSKIKEGETIYSCGGGGGANMG